MKKYILFCVCFIAIKTYCLGQTLATQLTAAEKAYILSRFCTEVKYNFAFYDKLKFDWDSLCLASMPLLLKTTSDEDFVKGMQILCTRLQDGHTEIFQTNNPTNPKEWIRPLPMKTKRIGDKVFVTDVFNSSLKNSGVSRGCEILEIDNENVLEYAGKHIQPFLSSSTQQWTKYRPFSEFELTKDKGSKTTKILFRNNRGEEFGIESNRNLPWDLKNNIPNINFKILNGNVGLLSVRSFQDSDFNRSYFEQLYDEILETDALIIDIRDNEGGNSSHADYMISHFCDQPIPQGLWKSPMYIAAHAAWNYPMEWYSYTPDPIMPVKKKIYKKPIVLLINSTTFSSAENFCVSFRGAKRGKIIGTPTGGSTGNPIFIDLGGGIGCNICTKHELDAEGNEFIGLGIQPDIIVEEDTDIFLKNKDNLIEKALEILKVNL